MLLGIVAGGFAALLMYNTQPIPAFAVPAGPVASLTPTESNWQAVIATQFLLNTTPLPTTDRTAAAAYEPPTPGWEDITPIVFQPGQIAGVSTPTPTPPGGGTPRATATPGPSPTPTVTPLIPAGPPTATPYKDWQPPPLRAPLAHGPRDHFWLQRPIEASAINYGLEWYHYGSDGLDDNLRVHHGEDMGNPSGIEIVAASDGTVIWADNGIEVMRPLETAGGEMVLWPEKITSYGNVMVIEHDFSYRGQPVYTLYAHMSMFIKQAGDRVKAGDVIGLVGATGHVGGAHLHFEVRVGWNSYFFTRNPYLWMAPYVGTGVVAGRLTYLDSDAPVEDNAVTLVDKHSGRVIRRHTTYSEGVNPDDDWNENFLFGDVPEGEYEVVTWVNGKRLVAEATVYEGATCFVELWAVDEEATAIPATPQELPTPESSEGE